MEDSEEGSEIMVDDEPMDPREMASFAETTAARAEASMGIGNDPVDAPRARVDPRFGS